MPASRRTTVRGGVSIATRPSSDARRSSRQVRRVEPLVGPRQLVHRPPPVTVDRCPLDRRRSRRCPPPRRHPYQEELLLLAVPHAVEGELRHLVPDRLAELVRRRPAARSPRPVPGRRPPPATRPGSSPPPGVNQYRCSGRAGSNPGTAAPGRRASTQQHPGGPPRGETVIATSLVDASAGSAPPRPLGRRRVRDRVERLRHGQPGGPADRPEDDERPPHHGVLGDGGASMFCWTAASAPASRRRRTGGRPSPTAAPSAR